MYLCLLKELYIKKNAIKKWSQMNSFYILENGIAFQSMTQKLEARKKGFTTF